MSVIQFISKFKVSVLIKFILLALLYNLFSAALNLTVRVESEKNRALHTCNPVNDVFEQERFVIDNVAYPRYIPSFLNKKINFTCLNQDKKPKIILHWNQKFLKRKLQIKKFEESFLSDNNCPVTNCQIISDRSRINDSSLIVFTINDKLNDIPNWRPADQRWVFDTYESPGTFDDYLNETGKNISLATLPNGVFNLSATYRSDSDFTSYYYTYLNFIWQKNPSFNVDFNFMANKTKMVFQIVSDCQVPSKREVYIKEMSKYIDVDVFGKCGKPCPNSMDFWTSPECKIRLVPEYKFYLGFENTICKDYMSEKFFLMLSFNIIPVVYGAGPYDLHVPKSGFINAFDFESPRHLAEYMIKVASNQTLYNSYFQWKQYISFLLYPKHFIICEMCIMLNLEQYFGMKRGSIVNTQNFWTSKNDCTTINEKSFKIIPF